ncbi:MAG: phosphate regulon sensor histidine kinase PhoR [Gammaproteobacteria bacterium]
MNQSWPQELLRLALLLAVAMLTGGIFGHIGIWLFIAVSIYLAWNIVNLYRLERWLGRSRRFNSPATTGVWGEICNHIYLLRRRERTRKRHLVQLLREIRNFTTAMPDGVIIMNHTGEIRWLNEAAGRLLHLRVPQDVGQRLPNLMRHPDFVRYLRGNHYDEPVSLVSPFSRTQHLTLRIVPYGLEQRLVLVRDTTRLRRLEEMRREFVANASHELRSPLTVMSGYLEAMHEDAQLMQDWRKPLEEMLHQAARMTAIVSDLLELSRLENEQHEAPYSPIDVPALIRRICEEALSLGCGPRDILLEVDEMLFLLGAEREIYSAFSNLLFNAMNYTPASGKVTLSWKQEGEAAQFTVADTGIGIPAEHIPRLTERFYRVDKSRHRASGGTGLGLAIVKHVLQHHGASLVISSEPGRGSVFSCRFTRERIRREADKAGTG